jgi:malate dehydrogenase (oxaloacetate-decarboxylating)
LDRDEEYGRKALEAHRKYKGKISIYPKVPIERLDDFNALYTPGVAEVSRVIEADSDEAYELTDKGNLVAIVSDGSRVLGLGNVGPEAAIPVMEGKALLFKYLGDVDAMPLCVRCSGADEIVDLVQSVAPTFGGINLEDIASPKCFEVQERLSSSLTMPVFHDDQHGTSVVVLAALLNALTVVGKKLSECRITFFGAGAAGLSAANLMLYAGASPDRVLICDRAGIINKGRTDLNAYKRRIANATNPQDIGGDMLSALKGADVLIALSRPGPWIPRDWIGAMSEDAVVFALANPVPEIWPEDAKEAGAKIVATGRGDFPNQVNNCLVFPSFFRGMLEVRSRSFNPEVLCAAARAIAGSVGDSLSEGRIVPTIDEAEVFVRTATQVALECMKQRLARIELSEMELKGNIERRILRARAAIDLLRNAGLLG